MGNAGNIVLVGFMGSGKSAVARALARALGWNVVDTDERIEQLAGCTVGEFFDRNGEEAFRRCETEVLASLGKLQRTVVSTGGGIVTREENWPLLQALGPVVALDADAGTTLARVKNARTRRPLLEVDDPLAEIERLKALRAAAYARAGLTIDTAGKSPEEIAAEIIAATGA